MNLRDSAERVVWSFVAAALGNIGAGAFFNVDALQAAAMAGISAAVSVVLLIARQRLAVLPDPGAGLPGLPVAKGEGGQTWVPVVAVVALLIGVALWAGWIVPR